MTTTTTVNIQLGTAFWLLIAVLIAGLILYLKLGSEKLSKVLTRGIGDAFKQKVQSF